MPCCWCSMRASTPWPARPARAAPSRCGAAARRPRWPCSCLPGSRRRHARAASHRKQTVGRSALPVVAAPRRPRRPHDASRHAFAQCLTSCLCFPSPLPSEPAAHGGGPCEGGAERGGVRGGAWSRAAAAHAEGSRGMGAKVHRRAGAGGLRGRRRCLPLCLLPRRPRATRTAWPTRSRRTATSRKWCARCGPVLCCAVLCCARRGCSCSRLVLLCSCACTARVPPCRAPPAPRRTRASPHTPALSAPVLLAPTPPHHTTPHSAPPLPRWQVTPASPHLLHGMVDGGEDYPLDAAPPLLALVPQVRVWLRRLHRALLSRC